MTEELISVLKPFLDNIDQKLNKIDKSNKYLFYSLITVVISLSLAIVGITYTIQSSHLKQIQYIYGYDSYNQTTKQNATNNNLSQEITKEVK